VDLPLIIEDSDRGECPCGAEYIVGRKGRREDPVNIRLEPRKKPEMKKTFADKIPFLRRLLLSINLPKKDSTEQD
jgi:hypothetical protein